MVGGAVRRNGTMEVGARKSLFQGGVTVEITL